MPIFEYVCAECGQPFEELVFSTRPPGEVTCPACQSKDVTRKISTFASRLSGGSAFSSGSSSSSSCSPANV